MTRHARARSLHRACLGSGRSNPAAPSARRCAGSASRSTGRASASPWTRACHARCPRFSCALHEDGLIYRGKRLVNWDPVLLTALSDLEVQSEEEEGTLWHLRYPFDGRFGRPRGRDDAPRDHARRHRGRRASRGCTLSASHRQNPALPLAERAIPLIADAYVDPAFGSGCVKITPAHDFNDYEIGLRQAATDQHLYTARALNDNVPRVSRSRPLRGAQARRRGPAGRRAC